MEFIHLKPRAKINLALDILGKRTDGYHELRTIMQTLTLHDDLTVRKTENREIILETNLKTLPIGAENLVYKAAEDLMRRYSLPGGLHIKLHKKIPIGAGLGGGSSDCAQTLLAMRRLFDLPISDDQLLDIGGQFGADVPFCLTQGTALAEGIGERLTFLPPLSGVYILLVKPIVSISTEQVYKKLDLDNLGSRPDIDLMISALKRNDIVLLANSMRNVLESVTEIENPIISSIKEVMKREKALGVLMSGSGPTVFGLYTKRSDAHSATRAIRRNLRVGGIFIEKAF